MSKHNLVELKKKSKNKSDCSAEEVEVATNVKLNPLYIVDCKDDIESLRWTTEDFWPKFYDGRHFLSTWDMCLSFQDKAWAQKYRFQFYSSPNLHACLECIKIMDNYFRSTFISKTLVETMTSARIPH